MYLRRKIDCVLDNWLDAKDNTPLLLVGIRQCGKTESVREFAKRNHLELIEINFWNNPDCITDFDGNLDVETIISNINLRFPNKKIDSENTLIFFDEIQECPRARLSFKNFKNESNYKIIGSGSYLGINGYIIGDSTPVPIGYENIVEMKTLDFEEFLLALGYKDQQINDLVKYFIDKKVIPENVHKIYKDLFLKYACIGGFPKVVMKYINTRKIVDAYKILNNIIFEMKGDFGRRKDSFNNPLFKAGEVSRIQEVFELIPSFLSKENKRFIVSKIKTGSSYDKNDAINYLKEAHIVAKVNNLHTPSLPLIGEKIESQFKLFPEDIGIVTSMFGIETLRAMNKGELGQGKGAIYEALTFDSLVKAGITPYYFSKDTGLEIDFVIAYKGFATLLEVKAKTGNTKSSKTVMNHAEHYGITKLIKIGDYNVSQVGDVITIPSYLVFALAKDDNDF